MKVVIPVAGKATRMRPFTHSKIKALLPVAGKAAVDHIIEPLLALEPSEIWFVTGGPMKEQFELHIRERYPDVPVRFAEQPAPRGPGDALWQAREAFDEPVLICYSDTIYDVDLSVVPAMRHNAIWGMEVEEWQRFGIISEEDGWMTGIVEKPKEFVGNLANIGMYYIYDHKRFIQELEEEMRTTQEGKEVYPIPCFDRMTKTGARFKVMMTKGWFDSGTVEQTLLSNQQLLDRKGSSYTPRPGVTVIDPVHIHRTAQVEDSTIGPHVTIGAHVVVKNTKLQDTIVDEHTTIEDSELKNSIIGRHSIIVGKTGKFVLGDHCQAIRHR